jgi:hypothetical protein
MTMRKLVLGLFVMSLGATAFASCSAAGTRFSASAVSDGAAQYATATPAAGCHALITEIHASLANFGTGAEIGPLTMYVSDGACATGTVLIAKYMSVGAAKGSLLQLDLTNLNLYASSGGVHPVRLGCRKHRGIGRLFSGGRELTGQP